jgi:hypothetical protein
MTQRILIGLTAINLALLMFHSLPYVAPALANSAAPVLRGRALEIVDDQGRVRASIKLHAAETFAPTGKHYPETVVLRLIDAQGRPEVKIAPSEEGAGLSFVGSADTTQVQLSADGAKTYLKLKNENGHQQQLIP